MIKRYNNLSFLFFIPGIIAQVAGFILMEKNKASGGPSALALTLGIGGTLLAITGFGYYAKAKGQSQFWGLAGLLGIVGLLLLSVLKDRSGDPWNA
jgi:hypothetical protein